MIRVPGGCGSNSPSFTTTILGTYACSAFSATLGLLHAPPAFKGGKRPRHHGGDLAALRFGDPGHDGSRTRACATSKGCHHQSTGSVQRVAIASAASSAACAPMMGLAPAPSPCWLIGNFLSAAQFSNVRQSVLIAAKGSPSVLIMRPAAQPMAIITSHPLWCDYPLLYEGSRFEV